MWDIKQKATNKQNKQIHKAQHHAFWGRRDWEDEEDKRGQVYGDGRRLDFG